MVVEAEMSLKGLKKSLAFNDDLLQCADTIAKVMQVIQWHSSFINCVYLEHGIEHLGIPISPLKKIDMYCNFVKTFCKEKMKQNSYICDTLSC